MELSKVSGHLLLKILIITSTTVSLDIFSTGNLGFLKEPDWEDIQSSNGSFDDPALRIIINATLPELAKNNSTKLPIVEAIISASFMKTLDLQGGRRYFVKAVVGETYCSLNNHNHNRECFEQNMMGSFKMCTIQLYYAPVNNQFGNNIITCWEMRNAINNSLINKAVETALEKIGEQIEESDLTLKEIERAYYFSFNTSETWFDKKYYLKLKINSSSNKTSEVLTCSGEIDLASVLPDSYMMYQFQCV